MRARSLRLSGRTRQQVLQRILQGGREIPRHGDWLRLRTYSLPLSPRGISSKLIVLLTFRSQPNPIPALRASQSKYNQTFALKAATTFRITRINRVDRQIYRLSPSLLLNAPTHRSPEVLLAAGHRLEFAALRANRRRRIYGV